MTVDDILSEFQLLLPPKQVELLPDINSEEKSVFKQLSYEPIHIDELCNQMKKDIQEVLSILPFIGIKKPGAVASWEIIYKICLIN